MSSRISKFQNPVAVPRQKRTVSAQQNGPDRHFAAAGGRFRFFQRQCYGFGISHGIRSYHCRPANALQKS